LKDPLLLIWLLLLLADVLVDIGAFALAEVGGGPNRLILRSLLVLCWIVLLQGIGISVRLVLFL